MAKDKYIEGQVCQFTYIKDILLDEEFMVFEDSEKERFLVPFRFYKTYQLKPNTLVNCLITKIDCKGKISFQPEHPFYKIGQTYDFDFVRMQITEEVEYNPLSEKTKVIKDYKIVVADIDGKEHRVIPKLWQRKKNYKPQTIKCQLTKIIDGHFLLANLEVHKPLINTLIKTLITKITTEHK
jgi:hypothetical protein